MGNEHDTGSVRRRISTALAVGAAAVLLASCGLGDKAALEERITAAPARLDGDVVSGTITVESRLLEAPEGGGVGGFGAPAPAVGDAPAFEIPDEGVALGQTVRRFTVDTASSRATLGDASADRDGATAVVFDDLVLFGRRAGVPADDARPWVRLDLGEVDDGAGELQPFDGTAPAAVTVLHPAIVLDLVAGTLTGSIEVVGDETLGDVATTHYDVNLAIDKALGDVRDDRYPEDRREHVDRLFELLGVDGDVHPADVWLDADGGLRRFSVALTQRPVTRVEFALIVTVDIDGATTTFDATTPTPEEVLSVDSVLRFISTVTAGGGADEDVPPSLAGTLGSDPETAES